MANKSGKFPSFQLPDWTLETASIRSGRSGTSGTPGSADSRRHYHSSGTGSGTGSGASDTDSYSVGVPDVMSVDFDFTGRSAPDFKDTPQHTPAHRVQPDVSMYDVNLAGDGIYSHVSAFKRHYIPQKGTRYLKGFNGATMTDDPEVLRIAVAIPFFNEERVELERTLTSLHKQLDLFEKQGMRIELQVQLLLDGWWSASDSMKEYMQELFPSLHRYAARGFDVIPTAPTDAATLEKATKETGLLSKSSFVRSLQARLSHGSFAATEAGSATDAAPRPGRGLASSTSVWSDSDGGSSDDESDDEVFSSPVSVRRVDSDLSLFTPRGLGLGSPASCDSRDDAFSPRSEVLSPHRKGRRHKHRLDSRRRLRRPPSVLKWQLPDMGDDVPDLPKKTARTLLLRYQQKDPESWAKHILPLNENDPENNIETFVLQRVRGGRIVPVTVGPRRQLPVTLFVKRDNRRKHNSHEWFFKAFANQLQPDLVFLTDCGTLYDDDCLYHLVRHLQKRPIAVGVTGRMRVMTKKMQGTDTNWFSIHQWLRYVQTFDFESSYAIALASFNISGMLPVMPGPCQLFRYKPITGIPLDYYFAMVNQNPEDGGMVVGNLLLAEDRILSEAVVLLAEQEQTTEWEPKSVFYFDPELSTNKVVTQRRRWNNGSIAGFYYLLVQHPSLIWDSLQPFWRKLFMHTFFMLMTMTYVVLLLSPAVFCTIFFYSLQLLEDHFADTWGWITQFKYVIVTYYMVQYVAWVAVHLHKKYVAWFFHLSLWTSVLLMIGVSGPIIATLVKLANNGEQAYNAEMIVFTPFLLLVLPLPLAVVVSLASMKEMLVAFIPYVLFLPMMLVSLPAYSIARLHDLSWGNRPSDSVNQNATTAASNPIEHDQEQVVDDEEPEENHPFAHLINTRAGSKSNRATFKRRLWTTTLTINAIVVGTNVGLFVTFILLGRGSSRAVFQVCMIAVATFSVLQMAISFIYFSIVNGRRLIRWLVRRSPCANYLVTRKVESTEDKAVTAKYLHDEDPTALQRNLKERRWWQRRRRQFGSEVKQFSTIRHERDDDDGQRRTGLLGAVASLFRRNKPSNDEVESVGIKPSTSGNMGGSKEVTKVRRPSTKGMRIGRRKRGKRYVVRPVQGSGIEEGTEEGSEMCSQETVVSAAVQDKLAKLAAAMQGEGGLPADTRKPHRLDMDDDDMMEGLPGIAEGSSFEDGSLGRLLESDHAWLAGSGTQLDMASGVFMINLPISDITKTVDSLRC